MVGRVECYIHSDNSSENKGGAIIKLSCDTDFAARTDEFIKFTKELAKLAYGAGKEDFISICEIFPQIKTWFVALKAELHENIEVLEIKVMKF